jgi:hypothetical protein
MPRLQGVKGLAVVVCAEALTTQQMRYHRLSRRVNKTESFFEVHISSMGDISEGNSKGLIPLNHFRLLSLLILVYAQSG